MVGFGLGLAAVGALLWLIGSNLPAGTKTGRLPGDLVIERPGFTLYAPIGLMVVISLGATLLFWLLGVLSRR